MKNKRMGQLCSQLEEQILEQADLSQSTIKRRIRMKLNQSQEDRKRSLHFRYTQIAIGISALIVLSATTVFAVSNIDIIRGFFSGDTSRIEQDIHEPKASVSNEDYRITLEQTLSDDFTTVVIFSVEALNQKAKKLLSEDDYPFMTPDAIKFELNGERRTARGMGSSLNEYDTDTKRHWILQIQGKEQLGEKALLQTNIAGADGVLLEIPLPVANHMDSFDIPINLYTDGSNPIRVYRIAISNITMSVEHENKKYDPMNPVEIPIYFKMKNGSVKTQNQVINVQSGFGVMTESGGFLETSQFASVLDLEEIQSIIVCDTEFPLRGGEAKPYAVDSSLKSVVIGPLFYEEWVLPLADVCKKLGADLNYNEEKGAVTVDYRGTKLDVDMKKNIWKLDGKILSPEMQKYQFLQNAETLYQNKGELVMEINAFETLFNVDIRVKFMKWFDDNEESQKYMKENGRYFKLTP